MRFVRSLLTIAAAAGATYLAARALRPPVPFPPPRRLAPPEPGSFDPLELPRPQQDALLAELGDMT